MGTALQGGGLRYGLSGEGREVVKGMSLVGNCDGNIQFQFLFFFFCLVLSWPTASMGGPSLFFFFSP